MASTKTYTLPTTGVWTATALDSTGTYETSEVSNSVSNVPRISVDMTTLSGWSSLASGSHNLTIKAIASGYITSDASTPVSFTKPASVYTITPTLENCTAESENPTTITEGTTATLIYKTTSDYNMQTAAPTVTGATVSSWTITNYYTVSATATNCFINGGASYSGELDEGGTVTFTITADGTSYKVPSSVSVIGASTQYSVASDTSATLTVSSPTQNISFTVVGEAQQSYPVKGQIITIESNQYRVLDISGSNAKLLGMFNASSSQVFDSGGSNVYDGSDLDTYLNTTWYGNQSATFQSAVNDSSITTSTYQYYDEPNTPDTPTYTYQYQYNGNDSDYENADRTATTSAITRKVYALDLKDIYDYFGKVCITSNELKTLFFNQTTAVSTYIWLRSAYASSSSYAWSVNGYGGYVYGLGISSSYAVRPALTIDLSMISWS